MRSIAKVATSFALLVLLALPARADKCKFGDHETDDPDPRGLKCTKCQELADAIAHGDKDASSSREVWTLAMSYGKTPTGIALPPRPRRLEIGLCRRGEFPVTRPELALATTKETEVYWYIYYEITNNDKVERPCFVDVCAESNKGKNTYTYHDCMVPECKDELRRIFAIKEGETLFTSEELRYVPPATAQNKPPVRDDATQQTNYATTKVARDEKDGIYKGGCAVLALPMIKPGETRKCVALFSKLDTEFDFLTVYFHGLANTTTSIPEFALQIAGIPQTPQTPGDSLNPEASPVAGAAEAELRLVNDPKMQEPEQNKRKVVERVFCLEFSCLGDEFAKTARPIVTNEEQLIRPKNLERDEGQPARYHEVGHFGQEIVEAEDAALEGKKVSPYTFLGRKWIQTEKSIKSDSR
jgi:hypothetical protein